MSGETDDVVKLEDDLSEAMDKGDEALADSLRELSGGDELTGDVDDVDADDGDAPAQAKPADEPEVVAGEKGKPAADEAAAVATGDKPGAAAETQASRPGQEEHVPISNKSGTGTIPYEVLSGARQQAARLEQELAATKAQLAEWQAKPAATAGPAKAPAGEAADEALSDEDFADLPPEMQKLHRQVQSLQSKLDQVSGTTSTIQANHHATETERVQSAIDEVQDLAEWQAKGGTLWKAAVEVDDQLKGDPAWANKPVQERFAQVARQVRSDVGLPPRSTAPPNPNTAAKPTAASVKPAPAVPSSLSEIPGGGAPDLDMQDTIERTSATGLQSRMRSMSDDQIDALLSRVS